VCAAIVVPVVVSRERPPTKSFDIIDIKKLEARGFAQKNLASRQLFELSAKL
jgi:hypothetical protein